MKKKLAIAIPTYNRPLILFDNLNSILDCCKKFEILIYILDDSNNVNTELIVKNLIKSNKFIFYKRNILNKGHDLNLLSSLRLPNSDYVWLIGDSVSINIDKISKIIDLINLYDFNLISFKGKNRNINFPSGSYKNHNEILAKFGWHLNFTGVTIYSKNVIKLINKINFSKYPNFVQFSLIFNYLSRKDSNFYWLNEEVILTDKRKESYWKKEIFEVFIHDWNNSVLNLPKKYELNFKEKTIYLHSKKTKIFGFRSILFLRSLGIYNFKKFLEFSLYLRKHSDLSNFLLFLIAITPSWIFINLLKFKKFYHNNRI